MIELQMIYKLECQISSTLMVPVQNREIAKKIRHKKSKKNLKTQFKNGQTEKAVNIVETIWKKFTKDDILKLFHDFNDEISLKFGSSYVIIDYFPTWGFHFGDHCSEWTLVKEYEQRLKILFCLQRLG